MDCIIDNWFIIFGLLAVIVMAVVFVVRFFKKSTDQQLANIKEWLLWATTEAEKHLGSGTGQLKLRYVYDMFAATFPWLAIIISFDTFSKLVDSALDEMNYMLDNNEAAKLYVNSNPTTEYIVFGATEQGETHGNIDESD